MNFTRISFIRLNQVYKSEIRKWLYDNPLTENQELDVHGVPVSLFDLTDADDRLKQLNRQIKGLPLQQQKLLLYLSRDLDPALREVLPNHWAACHHVPDFQSKPVTEPILNAKRTTSPAVLNLESGSVRA